MQTTITVVVDNTASNGISGEWGLSILVDYAGKKILLDAGASNLFLNNMKLLNIDVDDIDFVTLSHAHYDHANGLPAFLDNNKSATLFLREGTAPNCYAKKFIFHKYIGIPRKLLKKYDNRIEMITGDFKLMDGVYLIPHKTENLSDIGKRELMFQKNKSRWMPDDFSHEQSLVLDTDRGLVILNSCSHGGIVNIINEIKETFPDRPVYGYIGGFHLFNKSNSEIRDVAKNIKETGIKYVCTGYCTKERAFGILKEELGDVVNQMQVGYQVVI